MSTILIKFCTHIIPIFGNTSIRIALFFFQFKSLCDLNSYSYIRIQIKGLKNLHEVHHPNNTAVPFFLQPTKKRRCF